MATNDSANDGAKCPTCGGAPHSQPPAVVDVESALVQFFNSEDGAALGSAGDYYDRSPLETAIAAMTALVDFSKRSRAFRAFLNSRSVL